jgi:Gas vesicle protein
MTDVGRAAGPATAPPEPPQVALVDLLDRLFAKGIVVAGDITLSIADIDLVRVSLRALITSVHDPARLEAAEGGPR